MIIAVAVTNNVLSPHFGYCENFHLFQIQNETIESVNIIPNPGHEPGFLPSFLKGLDVNVMVSGSMGLKAIQLFQSQEIEVITGLQGDPSSIVKQIVKKQIQSSATPCEDHHH